MQWVKIIGFILIACTIWFYFGTPCGKDVNSDSTLKRIGCATADSAATLGQLLPEIVHTMLAYLIISGVVGGLGTVATVVVGFAKLKKRWSKQPPEGVIGDALTTIKEDVSKEKVILEKRGENITELERRVSEIKKIEEPLEDREGTGGEVVPEIKPEFEGG